MTENMCDSNATCGTAALKSSLASQRPHAIDLTPALSRRAWLTGVASVLSSIGLTGVASAANAAGKTVKIGKTSDIPVKSAKSYYVGSTYILVTQPSKGVFKAFNGVCTHEAVNIASIDGTNLVCTEHGATYNTTTGKVTGGPAPAGLKKYALTVKSGSLFITV